MLAVLAGLAIAVALGRQLASAGRDLARETARLGELGPELAGLKAGIEDLTASVGRARHQ